MIFNIGIDIIEINRIKNIIYKYNKLFISKIYTKNEIKLSNNLKNSNIFFTSRWSVKEALSKALKTGIKKGKCNWLDIHVLKKTSGEPIINVTGITKLYMKSLNIKKIFVSITHDKKYIISNVILEK